MNRYFEGGGYFKNVDIHITEHHPPESPPDALELYAIITYQQMQLEIRDIVDKANKKLEFYRRLRIGSQSRLNSVRIKSAKKLRYETWEKIKEIQQKYEARLRVFGMVLGVPGILESEDPVEELFTHLVDKHKSPPAQ